jgi:hypothetical protein
MKSAAIIATAGLIFSCAALAQQGAVQFDVRLLRHGKIVSSPRAVAEFGKTVTLAQGGVMKFEGSATAPDKDGNSFTSVKLYLFQDGEMKPSRSMSMLANLAKSPSIEYSVPGTDARFVVKPSLVVMRSAMAR